MSLVLSIGQPVLQDYGTHLPDLVAFCVAAVPLEVNSLLNAGFPEQVMAASNAHVESETTQQIAQLIESDVGVGGSTQDPRAYCSPIPA
jgi:hypothetical protein